MGDMEGDARILGGEDKGKTGLRCVGKVVSALPIFGFLYDLFVSGAPTLSDIKEVLNGQALLSALFMGAVSSYLAESGHADLQEADARLFCWYEGSSASGLLRLRVLISTYSFMTVITAIVCLYASTNGSDMQEYTAAGEYKDNRERVEVWWFFNRVVVFANVMSMTVGAITFGMATFTIAAMKFPDYALNTASNTTEQGELFLWPGGEHPDCPDTKAVVAWWDSSRTIYNCGLVYVLMGVILPLGILWATHWRLLWFHPVKQDGDGDDGLTAKLKEVDPSFPAKYLHVLATKKVRAENLMLMTVDHLVEHIGAPLGDALRMHAAWKSPSILPHDNESAHIQIQPATHPGQPASQPSYQSQASLPPVSPPNSQLGMQPALQAS